MLTDADRELYLERRLRAAALWEEVPTECFDMRDWMNNCGTRACALGWLALYCYDGWDRKEYSCNLDGVYGVPRRNGQESFSAAAEYFGITHEQATLLFSADSSFVYEDIDHSLITARDVARALLAMPVSEPPELAAPRLLIHFQLANA